MKSVSIVFAAALLLLAGQAAAQVWPAKPIRVVVPSAAGGIGDVLMRTIAPSMEARLGQRFIVEAKPGAGGDIGASDIARAAPDGYSLLLAPTAVYGVLPYVQKNVHYHPVKSFAPVTMVVDAPVILVINAGLPVRSLKELSAHIRANPGRLNVGSAGFGTPGHLLGELFGKMNGGMLSVTYNSGPQVAMAVQTNEVQMVFATLAGIRAQLAGGSARVIGALTRERMPEFPQVATALESGFPELGEVSSGWGMVAPRGTDAAIVGRLWAEIRVAMADPAARKRFADAGQLAVGNTPEEFGEFIRAELARWKRVVDQIGFKPR
jgi:tripartite-type tricarboxylate transporter receptor subunit TctC